MRTKILMLGTDQSSLTADAQLLRQEGLLVITAFNPLNVNEMANEVKPDIIFFDSQERNNLITDACQNFVNDPRFTNIAIILTLSGDSEYFVAAKKTNNTRNEWELAHNLTDAIRIALNTCANNIKPIAAIMGKSTSVHPANVPLLFC